MIYTKEFLSISKLDYILLIIHQNILHHEISTNKIYKIYLKFAIFMRKDTFYA